MTNNTVVDTSDPNALVFAHLAGYLAAVAEAITDAGVEHFATDYGDYILDEVRFTFDGEDAGVALIMNEHGDYSLAPTKRAEK